MVPRTISPCARMRGEVRGKTSRHTSWFAGTHLVCTCHNGDPLLSHHHGRRSSPRTLGFPRCRTSSTQMEGNLPRNVVSQQGEVKGADDEYWRQHLSERLDWRKEAEGEHEQLHCSLVDVASNRCADRFLGWRQCKATDDLKFHDGLTFSLLSRPVLLSRSCASKKMFQNWRETTVGGNYE